MGRAAVLNTIGYFAPHAGYSAAVRGRAGRWPGRGVQAMVGDCTAPAWRCAGRDPDGSALRPGASPAIVARRPERLPHLRRVSRTGLARCRRRLSWPWSYCH
jgi:hypothetical protein